MDTPHLSAHLDPLRKVIDEADRQLIQILARRFHAVKQVGALKQAEANHPVLDTERERRVQATWVQDAVALGLSAPFARRVLKEILNHSRRLQEALIENHQGPGRRIHCGYQGLAGSYSSMAASHLMAHRGAAESGFKGYGTFQEVGKALLHGEIDYGLLPVENSIGGSIADVRAVLVTHIHPDHYGLAGRVREASGAWIGLHPADAVMLESRYGDTDALLDDMSHFLADSGVPADKLPDLTFASMILKSMVTMAAPDVLFEDGGDVDLPGWSLRTIWTPGHSPGHVCFYSADRRLLISGDHVLPRITPNISANTQQVPNPLGDYLESLLKVQNLGTDEVLPAHEYRFSDLEGRLEEIITHHAGRLEEIEQVIATLPGSTAWDITVRLHWSRPWDDIEPFMQRQANGETLAHCILLELHERIRRQGGTPARFYAVAG